jgi:hypothetical protein
MKRLLCATALLLLVGCRGTARTYQLSFNVEDTERQKLLALMSTRVIERRLASYGEEVKDLSLRSDTAPFEITVSVENATALDLLTEDLVSPFKFRIMKEAPVGEPDVLVVEGHGPFMETGITEHDVEWLDSAPDEVPEKGRVTLTFTGEGRGKMSQVFKENVGKFIGIFVRDRLMAKLHVETNELKDDIVITEIPSVEIAQTFADDVNVGLHVIFSPAP